MDAKHDLPSLELLRHRFNYDPETGLLTYHNSPRPKINPPGSVVGYETEQGRGWLRVKINRKHYRLSRIVWKMYYGEDPPKGMSIDHINRDRCDNRICNLRLCSHLDNIKNRGAGGKYYQPKRDPL